jgi:hypothetical protein
MEERHRVSKVPFVETYREKVLEEQPLGSSIEREVVVIRIEKAQLRLNLLLAGFAVLLILLAVSAH